MHGQKRVENYLNIRSIYMFLPLLAQKRKHSLILQQHRYRQHKLRNKQNGYSYGSESEVRIRHRPHRILVRKGS